MGKVYGILPETLGRFQKKQEEDGQDHLGQQQSRLSGITPLFCRIPEQFGLKGTLKLIHGQGRAFPLYPRLLPDSSNLALDTSRGWNIQNHTWNELQKSSRKQKKKIPPSFNEMYSKTSFSNQNKQRFQHENKWE